MLPSDAGDVVISAANIWKAYRMWRDPAARLKASFLNLGANLLPGARLRAASASRLHTYYRDFYALKDISFEIRKGQSLGIIGINGSGKSTLLQILAGVLQPTSGSYFVEGKVAALLELGSGFDPKFTGLENVRLNASILGLSDKEIDRRMDEMLAFADIGDFIDQPVGTYSTGMRLRLAFAVQTAVDPDVLIVDEALAVGDVFFRAKCMRKMHDLQERGTTLLFVSHSLDLVKEMCDRSILLHRGEMLMDSDPSRTAQRYLSLVTNSDADRVAARKSPTSPPALSPSPPIALSSIAEFGDAALIPSSVAQAGFLERRAEFEKLAALDRIQNGQASIVNAQLLSADGLLADSFAFAEWAIYRLAIRVDEPVPHLWIGYQVKTKTGAEIVHGDSSLVEALGFRFEAGNTYLVDWGIHMKLKHGRYFMSASLAMPQPLGVTRPTWNHVDVINLAYGFSVRPRKAGMIGGTAVWPQGLRISRVDDAADTRG